MIRRTPLKRGKPPKRYTPLKRGKPPQRKTWLKSKRSTPRKTSRIQDRELLDAVKLQNCCACGKAPGDEWNPIDSAHLRSRGAGGGDTKDNLISFCRKDHSMQHQIGWALMVQRYPQLEKELAQRGWEISSEKKLVKR